MLLHLWKEILKSSFEFDADFLAQRKESCMCVKDRWTNPQTFTTLPRLDELNSSFDYQCYRIVHQELIKCEI